MKQTNISLTKPQHEKLNRASKETGLSKSELIRRALDDYFRFIKKEQETAQQ